jgi:hypothetical protein
MLRKKEVRSNFKSAESGAVRTWKVSNIYNNDQTNP